VQRLGAAWYRQGQRETMLPRCAAACRQPLALSSRAFSLLVGGLPTPFVAIKGLRRRKLRPPGERMLPGAAASGGAGTWRWLQVVRALFRSVVYDFLLVPLHASSLYVLLHPMV
jgi:hypothetical protein